MKVKIKLNGGIMPTKGTAGAAAAIARSTGAVAVEVAEAEVVNPETGEVVKVKKSTKK